MIGYIVDWNVVIQIVIGLAFTVFGFMYKELKNKVDKTHEDFLVYRTHVAERYVSVDQLTKAIENLNSTINSVASAVTRIEGRLNNQLDGRNHN